MGTNYYVEYNHCPECGWFETYHIGKSSAGWCFSIHVNPGKGIINIDDIIDLCKRKDSVIMDEYGVKHSLYFLKEIIFKRAWDIDWNRVPFGYSSVEEFLQKNNAEMGPNGLLRHKLSHGHCIKQGKGTYDYIIGEFS